MELEEAIKGLEGMIKGGGIWEGGFEDDEKEILERILHYIKEESIPKDVVEEKIRKLKKQSGGNVYHIQQTINSNIRLCEEILNKGGDKR